MKKTLRLSRYKYRALSQISINFSAVFLASLVLPVITEFDDIPLFVVLFGVVGAVVFIILSLEFAQKGK